MKSLLIMTFSNRFQILEDTLVDESEVRLVSDSMVHDQLPELCGCSSNGRRKPFYFPGTGLDDITAAYDDVTSNSENSTRFVIHAGTNDIHSSDSVELPDKYRLMIKQLISKTNGSNIVVSGILPRVGASSLFYDKAFRTNNRLKTLCAEESVLFINLWDHFYFDTHPSKSRRGIPLQKAAL
ncbi:hypothetical protein E2C01_100433 [Portunus trituberculatus]|uniref:SGNH hydrolase-type esterase domain-containing protein n=1 Tax=Portunus trituberculatus TaxID=210409 RepID=A0A5B7KHJ6_PORTR|nr:hypothetical protein [Portunus trituberculatus]